MLQNEIEHRQKQHETHIINLQRQHEADMAALFEANCYDSSPSSSLGRSFATAAPTNKHMVHLIRGRHSNRVPLTSQQQIMSAVTTATTSTTTTKSRHTDLDAFPFTVQYKPFDKIKSMLGMRQQSSILATAHNTNAITEKGEGTSDAKVKVKGKKLYIQTN